MSSIQFIKFLVALHGAQMGFSGNSTSFTRFRILDHVPDETVAGVLERLKKFSFNDIDNLPEIRSFGWVCFDDMLDNEWHTAPPQKAEYLCFSLRLDTRRIPAGVIKKHLAIALRAEKASLDGENHKFISRERKKEIKENVLLKLRERFLPTPAEFNVIWNTRSNEIWFASIQTKMVEMFMEVFLSTFELHLEEYTPYNLGCALLPENKSGALDELEETTFINDGSRFSVFVQAGSESPDLVLGEEFLTWLWCQSDNAPDSFRDMAGEPFAVYMEQRIVVSGGSGEARETATVSGPLSPLREARFGLGTGKKVTRALVRIEKSGMAFQFTLAASDFRIGALKTPKLDRSDADAEPDVLLLEKIYLIESCLKALDSLYLNFLEKRLAPDWEKTAIQICEWFTKKD